MKSGIGTALAQTAYIYDGSTEIAGVSVINGVASFIDLGYTIPKDTTKTLTIRIDIRSANSSVANFTTSISSTGITAENSTGDLVLNKSGNVNGNSIGVRNFGPEITLISKSIATGGVPQINSFPISTSTLTATFNVKIKAVGGDIILGTSASSTPLFSKNGATNSFKLYDGGVASSISNATSSSFTIPSICTTFGVASCTLAEGNEVTIPVTFMILGRTATGDPVTSGIYSVGLEKVNWNNGQTSSFMAGETDWRTAEVGFP